MGTDDVDLDSLETTLNSIEICQKTLLDENLTCHTGDVWIDTHKRSVEIKCNTKIAPFTIYGGIECDQLILIDIVHHPDLLGTLSTNDILLSINSRNVSGMTLGSVCAVLDMNFDNEETLQLDVISEGHFSGK